MRRTNTITAGLAILFFLSLVIPDDWIDSFRFGEIPLGAFLLSVLCLLLLGQLVRMPGAVSGWLMGGFVALMITTAWGYFRGNIETYTLKFFVYDLFCFVALLAGHIMARTRSPEDTIRLVSRMSLAAGLVIVANYIGVFTNVLSPAASGEGRTATSAIFNAVGTLLILLPWATISARSSSLRVGWRTWFLFGVPVGTGLLSATRSIIIEIILGAALYLILRRRRLGGQSLLRLSGVVGVVAVLLIFSLPQTGTLTLDRFNGTQLGEETRSEELSLWWPQVNGDLLTGQGMGSRFISNIVVNQDTMASAPHIGIATFLMKGGIFLFLGYAVLPLFVAAFVLFSPNLAEAQRAAAASVLMFIGLACLSGGWSPQYLFVYGMAISSMTFQWQRRTSSILRPAGKSRKSSRHAILPVLAEE
jgi:hypothetical protein